MKTLPFRSAWLEKFGLSETGWRSEAEKHLRAQAFSRPNRQLPLLDYLFKDLPDKVEKSSAPSYRHIAEAFAFCCHQFWLCKSHFPLYAHAYAEFLAEHLKNGSAGVGTEADVLADLLLGSNGISEPLPGGYNPPEPKDAAGIREGEHIAKAGAYEEFLKPEGQQKVAEFERRLKNDPKFQDDWNLLRKTFSGPASESFIRRSKIPERNWGQGHGAKFEKEAERFQAFFDLFCWKYFLWGMQEGEPLLQKPFVAYTPYGTQLFIPGYLSFDAKRDFDFAKINKLHKARGIRRQGPAFSENRLEGEELRKQARAANDEARQIGLKGEKRDDFIRNRLGMPELDERRIRELTRKN